MNKLGWGIVAISLVLAGVTVYSFTQIATLQTQINSLSKQIAEKNETFEGKTVKIGYIASSSQSLVTAKPYIEKIIVPDMNAYCKQIGRNVTL